MISNVVPCSKRKYIYIHRMGAEEMKTNIFAPPHVQSPRLKTNRWTQLVQLVVVRVTRVASNASKAAHYEAWSSNRSPQLAPCFATLSKSGPRGQQAESGMRQGTIQRGETLYRYTVPSHPGALNRYPGSSRARKGQFALDKDSGNSQRNIEPSLHLLRMWLALLPQARGMAECRGGFRRVRVRG